MSNSLYECDFYAWANEQAALLRAGKLGDADIENIADEIESMGRGEKRELVSRLTVLLTHLLQWQYQPERRGKSWLRTIQQQRFRITDHLGENPSLKSQLASAIRTAFRDARIEAERETDIDQDTFPATCPYTFDETMAEDFWPD